MDIFDEYPITPMIRRLKKEYSELILKYQYIFVSKSYNPGYIINIDVIDKKDNIISFHFKNEYPFVTPFILYNGRKVQCCSLLPTERFNQTYYKLYNQYCFCSFLYNTNSSWSPAITMYKLIQQFKLIQNKQSNITTKILVDKIKEKYLIDDIDLLCWLF
jgi:hypothetical protein